MVGRGSRMFYRVCEESTVVAPPDLVRPIDAPSRGSERSSTVEIWWRGSGGRKVIRSHTEYPRLGTGFGIGRRWDRVHLRLR